MMDDLYSKPHGPNIRVPPLYFVGGFLVGLLIDATYSPIRIASGAQLTTLVWIGWVVFAIGMVVAHTGLITFILAGTPWLPFSPATRLVQHGFYRVTRNPMYLGLTIGYVGLALVLNTLWPLLLLPLVLWGLIKTVIEAEEAYLEKTFGDDYVAYKKRVRRWL